MQLSFPYFILQTQSPWPPQTPNFYFLNSGRLLTLTWIPLPALQPQNSPQPVSWEIVGLILLPFFQECVVPSDVQCQKSFHIFCLDILLVCLRQMDKSGLCYIISAKLEFHIGRVFCQYLKKCHYILCYFIISVVFFFFFPDCF